MKNYFKIISFFIVLSVFFILLAVNIYHVIAPE